MAAAMIEPPEPPAPGSDEAIAAGCKCPVRDNGRGRGARLDEQGKPLYWITVGCPLHWAEAE